ncbi:MAG: nuclear transport factor 2 family protein [Acidobacteria bacterium]|nr:nuclear transport factor 2 family protein [Acidobacteriota bacterium]
MKRLVVLLSLACGLSAPAPAQGGKKPGKDERTKQELMQLERDIGRANVERDAAFFERVEADEFLFTDSGGGLTTKREDVESVKAPANPDVKLLAYDVDDMKVMLYGKTAVVAGRATTRGLVRGQESTAQSRFTDVFVRRDGRWQLVAGHSSRLPAPRK